MSEGGVYEAGVKKRMSMSGEGVCGAGEEESLRISEGGVYIQDWRRV
jgi:hypothetical protein